MSFPFTDNTKDMTALLRVIQMAVPLLLTVAPLFLYRKKGRHLIRFCLSMATVPKRRKGYMFILAVVSLLFNYAFFALRGARLWQVPGFLLAAALLHYRFTDAMLQWLHEDRMLQGLAFGFILLSLILPELHTLSVTMALILTAAFFYPSRAIMDRDRYPESYLRFHLTNDDIVNLYYSSSRASGRRHPGAHGCRCGRGREQHQNKQDND